MKPSFDHEKLHAYQESLAFIRWLNPILERILHELASMLVGLIKSNSSDRLYEEPAEYRVGSNA
jgi:hypothetical protein